MGKLVDETGNVYFYLTVLNKEPSVNGTAMWRCKCKCGNICVVAGSSLRRGNSKSCGCYQKEIARNVKFQDLTGRRFGKLFVNRNTWNTNKSGKFIWECVCDCGKSVNVASDRLLSGGTKSCGCLQKEVVSKNNIKDLQGMKFNRLFVEAIVGINSRHQMEWMCLCDCGNHKVATTAELLRGRVISCGCNKSCGEQVVQMWLETHEIVFEKEKRFDDCRDKKSLPFDFYLPQYRACIEFDGVQHYQEIKRFSKNSLDDRKNHDEIKTQYCSDNGIRLLRIPYWEKDHIESILSEWLNIDSAEEANSSSTGLSA